MITFYLNSEVKTIEHSISIIDAITRWGYNNNSIAIAMNAVFIPKIDYEITFIHENDRIDIVTAMQGG